MTPPGTEALVVGGLGSTRTLLRLVAFTVAAGVTGGAVAVVYRWYSRQRVPAAPALMFGLGVVAVYLNTVGLYGDLLTGEVTPLFTPEVIAFNLVALLLAMVGAGGGRAVGDRLATDVFVALGVRELDADVGRLTRTVRRITDVELPAEIDDMKGYDPVRPEVKAELAGKTLLFGRRPTVVLRDRVITRIKEDYGVSHVDLEMNDDGTVEYLAVGSRAAGVGPTLAPGTVACSIRADPGAGAGPGDVVQVWRTDPAPERVAAAELRAAAGGVATVAIDAAEASALDPATTYRLVTLPAEPRAAREFAAALRAADETMGVVTVEPGSELEGIAVGDVGVTVAAVRSAGKVVEAIPPRTHALAAGDALYVVGRPEDLRRLETQAAEGAAGSHADAQPS